MKTWSVPVFLLLACSALGAPPAYAEGCKVFDPELQASYSGPCVKGLAEGEGMASGSAEYRGGFKAGRKHGKGVKTWPNGDRYEGGFVEDRKEGAGIYTWGRGPWAGERYEGEYLADKRHGKGTYRWPTGDVYSGPWDNDRIAGPGTPMMAARAKYEAEARAAVARVGQKVCREVPVGIGERDWVSGVVVELTEDKVAVRLDDACKQPHVVGGIELRVNETTWDEPQAWTPCW